MSGHSHSFSPLPTMGGSFGDGSHLSGSDVIRRAESHSGDQQTSALIASNLELDTLLQTVLDIAVELSGAKLKAFCYSGIGEDAKPFSLYSLAGAQRSVFSSYFHPRATPVFEPTFIGTFVVRSDDVMIDPQYGQWAPHHGMP